MINIIGNKMINFNENLMINIRALISDPNSIDEWIEKQIIHPTHPFESNRKEFAEILLELSAKINYQWELIDFLQSIINLGELIHYYWN